MKFQKAGLLKQLILSTNDYNGNLLIDLDLMVLKKSNLTYGLRILIGAH